MKKITLLKKATVLFAFMCLSYGVDAQYLTEDFDAGFPATWSTIDGDGATYNANLGWATTTGSWTVFDDYDNPGVGDSAAVSSSWYDPVTPADVWMITPQMTIGVNSQVIYTEKAQDASYPDGYELRISTTTPDVAGFNANPALYTTAAASNPASQQTISLAAYPNATIYLAWHNNSTDQFVLMIDDVEVNEVGAGADDAAVSAINTLEYTEIPLGLGIGLDLGGTIESVGNTALTGATLTVNVYNGASVVYTNSSAGTALAPGASATEALGTYTPVGTGLHTMEYIVSVNETDVDILNDTLMTGVMVTDSTLSRDDNVVTGTLGIGAGTTGWLGNEFNIPAAGELTSLTWVIDPNATSTMDGQFTRAEVYDMSGGVPNAIIAVTDSVQLTGPGPHVVTMPIVGGPFTVPADFVAMVVEGDSNTVIATTSGIFTPTKGWVDFVGSPTGTWANNEDFNFNVVYMMRANFGGDPGVSLQENVLTNNVEIYPNPTSSDFTVAVSGLTTNELTISITDASGKVIMTKEVTDVSENVEVPVQMNGLNEGIYFVKISSDGQHTTERVIITK